MMASHLLKVKNGAGWRNFARVRLQISVGQAYHEGTKLAAVVDWINRNASIRSVDISVNDDLQAHSLIALGHDSETALTLAARAGDEYIFRTRDIISKIKVPATIMRWSDWQQAPEMGDATAAFATAYDRHPQLRAACDADSRWIVDQRAKQGTPVDDVDRWIMHSTNYVREEMAVFAVQSASRPAAEIYPGRNLAAAEYFLSAPTVAGLEGLRNRYFTRVDFKRVVPASASTQDG
jgi:tRNA-dependent cyclodipeptide synthase